MLLNYLLYLLKALLSQVAGVKFLKYRAKEFINKHNIMLRDERPRLFGRDAGSKARGKRRNPLAFSVSALGPIPVDPAGGHCYGSATKTCKS